MKNKLSIFATTTLIILPLVLIVNIAELVATHNYIFRTTYQHYIHDLQNAAVLADQLIMDEDLEDPETAESESIALLRLCEIFDIPYLYVFEVDTEKNSIKYLAIGTGKEASEKFITERPAGTVVQDAVDEPVLAALNGDAEHAVDHITNAFDDTLIVYLKRSSTAHPNEIISAEISIVDVMADLNHTFYHVAGLTILYTVALVVIFSLIIRRRVSRPAQAISKKMSRFVHERESGFEPLKVKGSKEFTEMATSFNLMAEEIDRYLSELSELNRQKAQLSVARDIQMGLLQPPKYDSDAASVRACMLPARHVGGDLYDYQALPDGRFCVLIADVSGKGVSAALFMSRAITLLHQYAESGLQPGRILYEYNNHLAARNPNMLFITTFVGIYDPQTGTLVYANAGHNYPYLISDRLTVLDGEHGTAAGIFTDQSYPEHTVAMKPGDLLFLYTDGVTEAKNPENRLYGEAALEDVLRGLIGSKDKEAIPAALESIQAFSKGAEQADDITMLTLQIPCTQRKELHLEAKAERLTEIIAAVSALNLPEEIKNQIRFIAEEMFVNICSYAYPDGAGTADVCIEADNRQVVLTFTDSGEPFDPTQDVLQIEQYDINNSVGGLGRFLTFSMADAYAYERRDEKNILTITKKLTDEQGGVG